MAQANKKSFSAAAAPQEMPQDAARDAFANTPFAFWSNLAETQRQYLASLVGNAGQKAGEGMNANVTELRPNEIAPQAAAIGQNWMTAVAECQRELTSFAKDRLTKNQAFLASAVAAHDVQDLVQLQAGWMQQTAQDYTKELGKLSDIVKNGADEAIAVTA